MMEPAVDRVGQSRAISSRRPGRPVVKPGPYPIVFRIVLIKILSEQSIMSRVGPAP